MEKDTPKWSMVPACREFAYRGRVLVRISYHLPALEGKEKINAFYEKMAENLLAYAEKLAREREDVFLHGAREERRNFRELNLRFSPRITYLDGEYVSILWEIFRAARGERPTAKRVAQTFSLERETLLPPTVFLGARGKKISSDAPYYLTESGVNFL